MSNTKQHHLGSTRRLFRVLWKRKVYVDADSSTFKFEEVEEFHVAPRIEDVWKEVHKWKNEVGCDDELVGINDVLPILSVIEPEGEISLEHFVCWAEGVYDDYEALKPDDYDDDDVQKELEESMRQSREFLNNFKRQRGL